MGVASTSYSVMKKERESMWIIRLKRRGLCIYVKGNSKYSQIAHKVWTRKEFFGAHMSYNHHN